MHHYQVPQFITVEDKILGPLTLKQALYLGEGAFLIWFAGKFLASFLFFPTAFVLGGSAAALAFMRINEQPLPVLIKNAILFFARPRIYIWRPGMRAPAPPKTIAKKNDANIQTIPRMSESKLSDLAWSLDIKEKRYEK